ncbi:unnamed protein product [Effrenium voratum]|uniref:Uncharacterized protein n=1 Tax=Effrenium voratum TaxID=2562239 RepID=A0AA36J255_9DINO|nr:unnamed protein product [Effrenium voratum]
MSATLTRSTSFTREGPTVRVTPSPAVWPRPVLVQCKVPSSQLESLQETPLLVPLDAGAMQLRNLQPKNVLEHKQLSWDFKCGRKVKLDIRPAKQSVEMQLRPTAWKDGGAVVIVCLVAFNPALGKGVWRLLGHAEVIVIRMRCEEKQLLEDVGKVFRELKRWAVHLQHGSCGAPQGMHDAKTAVGTIQQVKAQISTEMLKLMRVGFSDAARITFQEMEQTWVSEREPQIQDCREMSYTLDGFPMFEFNAEEDASPVQGAWHMVSMKVCDLFLQLQKMYADALIEVSESEAKAILEFVAPVREELDAWAAYLQEVLQVQHVQSHRARKIIKASWREIITQMQALLPGTMTNAAKVLIEGCPKRLARHVSRTLSGFPPLETPSCFMVAGEPPTLTQKVKRVVSQELCALFLQLQQMYKPVCVTQASPEEAAVLEFASQVGQELTAWAAYLREASEASDLPASDADSAAAVDLVGRAQQLIWANIQKLTGLTGQFSNAAKVLLEGCSKRAAGPVARTLSGFPPLETPSCFMVSGELPTLSQKVKSVVSQELCALFLQLQHMYKPVCVIQASPEEAAVLEFASQVGQELTAWAAYLREASDLPGSDADSAAAVDLVARAQQLIWANIQELTGLTGQFSNAAKVLLEGCSKRAAGPVARTLSGYPPLETPSCFMVAGEPPTLSQKVKSVVSQELCALFLQLQQMYKPVCVIQASPEEAAVLEFASQVGQELTAWAAYLREASEASDSAAAVDLVARAQQLIWANIQELTGLTGQFSNAAKVLLDGCSKRAAGPVARTLSGFPPLETPSCFMVAGEPPTLSQKVQSVVSQELCALFLQLQQMYKPVCVIQASPEEAAVLEFASQVGQELTAWAAYLREASEASDSAAAVDLVARAQQLIWANIQELTGLTGQFSNAAKVLLEGCSKRAAGPVARTLSGFPPLETPSCFMVAGEPPMLSQKVQSVVSQELCALFLQLQQMYKPVCVIQASPEEAAVLEFASQVGQELTAWAAYLREASEASDLAAAVDLVARAQQLIWANIQELTGLTGQFSNAAKVLLEGCSKRAAGPVARTLSGFPPLETPSCFMVAGEPPTLSHQKVKRVVSQELCALFLQLQQMYKPVSVIQASPEEAAVLEFASQVGQELTAWAAYLREAPEASDSAAAVDLVAGAQQLIWANIQELTGLTGQFSNAAKVLLEGCSKRAAGPVARTLSGYPPLETPSCFMVAGEPPTLSQKVKRVVSQELCALFLQLQQMYKPVCVIQASPEEAAVLEFASQVGQELTAWAAYLREASEASDSAAAVDLVARAQQLIWANIQELTGLTGQFSNAAKVLLEGCSKRAAGPVARTLSGFPPLETPSCFMVAGEPPTLSQKVKIVVSQELCALFLQLQQMYKPVCVIQASPEEAAVLEFASQVGQELTAWAAYLREASEASDSAAAVDLVARAQQLIWANIQELTGLTGQFSNAAKVLLEGCSKRAAGPVARTLSGFPPLETPSCFMVAGEPPTLSQKVKRVVSQELCALFLQLQQMYKPVCVIQASPEEAAVLEFASQVGQELTAWAAYLREASEASDSAAAVDLVARAQQLIWANIQELTGLTGQFSNAAKVLLEGCSKRAAGRVARTLSGFPPLETPSCFMVAGEPPTLSQKVKRVVSQELCALFLQLQQMYKPVCVIQASPEEAAVLEFASQVGQELTAWAAYLREASEASDSAAAVDLVARAQQLIWANIQELTGLTGQFSNAAKVLLEGCSA